MKLELFLKQLSGKKFDNFQHFRERVASYDLDEDTYMSKVAELLNVS